MDKLHQWLLLQRQRATDGTAIAKAIDYSLGRWPALIRFIDDGTLPVDNNWWRIGFAPLRSDVPTRCFADRCARESGRRRVATSRPRPILATGANFLWAYDFVFDACANGQSLKCLTLIDEFTRECLAIDVAGSIRSERIIEVLARLISERGAPRYLRSDNVLNASRLHRRATGILSMCEAASSW